MERPQHILLNVSCVYTSVFIFSTPLPKHGAELFIPVMPGMQTPPVGAARAGLARGSHLCSLAELALMPGWNGQVGQGWTSAVLALPSGDGSSAAPWCGASPPLCLGGHPEGPRVVLTPQAPLVLWRPQQPRAPKRSWHCPGAQAWSRAGQRADTGICTYPQVFPAARKRGLSVFPFSLDGDGAGPEPGP